MCRTASLFLLQRLKGSMSGDARDFNNIETPAVIKFFPARQDVKGISRHCMPQSKTGLHRLNVVNFPPVIHLVLDNPKQ